jgi:hypothetical protein
MFRNEAEACGEVSITTACITALGRDISSKAQALVRKDVWVADAAAMCGAGIAARMTTGHVGSNWPQWGVASRLMGSLLEASGQL